MVDGGFGHKVSSDRDCFHQSEIAPVKRKALHILKSLGGRKIIEVLKTRESGIVEDKALEVGTRDLRETINCHQL